MGKIVSVYTESWQRPVTDKNGIKGIIWSELANNANIKVISVSPRGQAMFYCQNCDLAFSTKFSKCPECGSVDPQPKTEQPSTTVDGHF